MKGLSNIIFAVSLFALISCVHNTMEALEDQYSWLEDSDSPKVKSWIAIQTAASDSKLGSSAEFKRALKATEKILNSEFQIPRLTGHGRFFYTLYKPNGESRGLWKRSKPEGLAKPVAKWETVLNMDSYNKRQKASYTFKGSVCLEPQGNPCLIGISKSGGDSTVYKEYDVVKKDFVPNGFFIPDAKTMVNWVDANHIAVNTAFKGSQLTNIEFGTELRIIKRGERLGDAKVQVTIPKDYLAIFVNQYSTNGKRYTTAVRYYSQTKFDTWIVNSEDVKKIAMPEGTSFWGVVKDFAVLSLANEWKIGNKVYVPGQVLSIPVSALLSPKGVQDSDPVYVVGKPKKNKYFNSRVDVAKDFIIVSTINDVKGGIDIIRVNGNKFDPVSVDIPSGVSVEQNAVLPSLNVATVNYEGFLTPPSLMLINLDQGTQKVVNNEKPAFNSKNMQVIQKWAKSKDDVSVPYYLVGDKDVIKKGAAPLVINAYGAYGISSLPWYWKIYGKNWLNKGGLFVVANVRGGSELGDSWYKGAIKENKIKSIEDFIAVSKDLIKEGITTSDKLGIYGGSMGGVIIGGAITMAPELYKAAVMPFPVLDLIRGKKLVFGNWLGEIGDPDIPEERSYILKYAPYEKIKKGVAYPSQFLFAPSTDDRVHPANARKWVAKMKENSSGGPVFYLETGEGGHKGGSTNEQQAYWRTMNLEFFRQQLM